MWGFMKKLTDKDKEEKEKKRRDKLEKEKKKVDHTLTAEELIRLNEAERSLTLKSVASTQESSSNDSGPMLDLPVITSKSTAPVKKLSRPNPPAVQPKPSKKGILKIKHSGSSLNKNVLNSSDSNQEQNSISKKDIKNIISTFDKTLDQKPIQPIYKRTKPIPQSPKNAKPVLLLSGHQVEPQIDLPLSDPLILRPESPIHNFFDTFPLQLPTTSNPISPPNRSITLKRSQNGDLGLSLRKGLTVDRSEKDAWRQVIFAEAGKGKLGLRPGDRIVEVEGSSVEGMNREGVVELLKRGGEEVKMVVRTVPELVELAGRNVGEGVTSGSTRRVGRATSIKYQHQKVAFNIDELFKQHLNGI